MKIKKIKVSSKRIYRLLHPRHTVLVSCADKNGRSNIITLAWTMPTSINPPMVAMSVSPKRYSYRIIEKSGEFVVNVPTMKLAKKSLFCGRTSGTKVDKFKETKLTPMPAKKVKPPLIQECVAHLECKLVQKITTGDHTLFVGEVLAAYVNKGVFTETFNSEKVKPLFHMGGDDFVTISPEVVTPRRPRKAKN